MFPNAVRNIYGSVNIFREKLYEELGAGYGEDKLKVLFNGYVGS